MTEVQRVSAETHSGVHNMWNLLLDFISVVIRPNKSICFLQGWACRPLSTALCHRGLNGPPPCLAAWPYGALNHNNVKQELRRHKNMRRSSKNFTNTPAKAMLFNVTHRLQMTVKIPSLKFSPKYFHQEDKISWLVTFTNTRQSMPGDCGPMNHVRGLHPDIPEEERHTEDKYGVSVLWTDDWLV